MGSEERDADKPFKVQDRRRFSATGEARSEGDAPTSEPAPDVPQDVPVDAVAAEQAAAEQAAAYFGEPAELSFATFVISLSTQALALLGEIPDPVQGRTAVDLEGARQFIDILGILQEKTRGNLDAREGALLEGALYDLRMKYVERANR